MTRMRLVLATAAIAMPTFASAEFRLHILHINDFHSRIESITASESTCDAEGEAAGECFGGVARLKAAIDAKRAELEGENVLVLDAGDQFQGSAFFTTYSGQAEAEFMNAIGFDAMALGNHEFDLGPEPLAAFMQAVEAPVISGSVDLSQDNRLAGLAEDHLVLEIGGERVAVVGATTTDTVEIASPGPTVAFRDPKSYLAETAAALEAQGVNKIIALTHVGVPEDLTIAAEVPGIDAIVGGHSHTLFSNSSEDAEFPYPHRAEDPDGEVPVVQAGAYSKYLGHLVLVFDDEGRVTEASGDTTLLDASVEPDPAVLARIEELKAPIAEMLSRVVAGVAEPIDGSRETCRAGECEMGNLVADAMLDRVADQGVTIAIQNGGGLRASIDAGEVTMGEIVTVLPFQNTLATFDLTGADIVAALENGLSEVEEGSGRFPQAAGIKYRWDPAQPPGSRVTEVLVARDGGFVPLEPDAVYGVVSNNFMRGGGDGYTVLRDNARNAYDFGPNLELVLADYLADRPDYLPYTDGRISTIE
jgi:5'-nucleotidase / UDP-sugar diphosphatase